MTTNKKNTEFVGLRIDEKTINELRYNSQTEGLNHTEKIRQLIKQYNKTREVARKWKLMTNSERTTKHN